MSKNIKKNEFPVDSQLTTIDKHAFHHLPIEHIVIPKHVQYIFERPFYKCTKLQTIEFSECSEFISIDMQVFNKLPIVSIITKINNSKLNQTATISRVNEIFKDGCSSWGCFI